MVYISLFLGILLVGIGFAMLIIRMHAKKGLPMNIIPSGLLVVPVMSLAFAANYWINENMMFSYISFGVWVVLPLLYSYTLYLFGKRSETVWKKILIDCIFIMLLLLSLPKDTFLFKGIFGSLELPQYVDNLLFVPVAIYLLSSFRGKNTYDGFCPMFVGVMGLGLTGLVFPFRETVGESLISVGIILGFSSGVLFAFNQYPAKIPMSDTASSPLILMFLWFIMQFTSKGMVMVLPSVFSYILAEDVISLIKKIINRIKYFKRMNIDEDPYYLQVCKRGFRPDVTLSYIMKWHVGLVLVAYVVCEPRIPYMHAITMAFMSGFCVLYMLSRKGVKDPSIKEITTEVFSELKNAFSNTKEQIKEKSKDNDGK